MLGDEKTEGSFKQRLKELNEEIAEQEAYAKGSTGSLWRDIGVAMGGSPGRGFLEAMQKKAPGELERLRVKRDQIFRNMESAGDRQRSAEAHAAALAKDVDATRDFSRTGKTQAHELFEKGAGLIREGEQRRGANVRRFATEGATLNTEADAAYIKELIHKAEEWRRQRDQLIGLTEKLIGVRQDDRTRIERLEQRMQSQQSR